MLHMAGVKVTEWALVIHDSCAFITVNTDVVVGLTKEDAEKQYILVVKRLTDIYGI